MEKLDFNHIIINENTLDKEDVLNLNRLQKQLLIEENIMATIEECELIWSGYSNDLHASWLFFPKDDKDILSMIKSNSYFISFENYLI